MFLLLPSASSILSASLSLGAKLYSLVSYLIFWYHLVGKDILGYFTVQVWFLHPGVCLSGFRMHKCCAWDLFQLVFVLVMPLFKIAGAILLQMAPPGIPFSTMSKCCRQVAAREDVSEVSEARFWGLVPGHVVGLLWLQVRGGMGERPVLQPAHGLFHDLGVQDLTMQIICVEL